MTKNNTSKKDKDTISAAIDLLVDNGLDLSNALSEGGVLKQLTKRLVEKALEAEMADHLGYTKYDRTHSENSRNGLSQKNLVTDNGVITVDVPRDRESTFEPAIIPKRQTRINGLDQKILSLYAKGMSLSLFQKLFDKLFFVPLECSECLLFTDDVVEDVKA